MPTLLVKNIHTLVTMDDERREIRHGELLIRDNAIEQVGTTAELPDTADEVLDLKDRHLVLPGLVNTHHNFFQNLNPVTMARAMGLATEADRPAYLSGRIPVKQYATASSPLTGTVS